MATSRRATLFWSMITIANIIAAGFLVFSLLFMFTRDGNQPDEVDESAVGFFLRCMRLQGLYNLPEEELRSHRDKWEAIACHDTFRLLHFSYQDTGRLAPGYAEALLVWHKQNQTLVDIKICGLDFSRCSDQTKELAFRYTDELPCPWQEDSF